MRALSLVAGHVGKSLVGELSLRIVALPVSFVGSGGVRYVPVHADRNRVLVGDIGQLVLAVL
eukprot:200163-Pyramimonas_sp.AAC.2